MEERKILAQLILVKANESTKKEIKLLETELENIKNGKEVFPNIHCLLKL